MTPIELSLKTWYPIDHPLHLDPLHPAIGLAGEAGELLDLYKKERFKEGASWFDCVHCGNEKHKNISTAELQTAAIKSVAFSHCGNYTPKILDELGDLWFYLRIIIYQFELSMSIPLLQTSQPKIEVILSQLNTNCALFLDDQITGVMGENTKLATLDKINYCFHLFLRELDCSLDQLTEINWNKLKDGDHHGWKATLSQK